MIDFVSEFDAAVPDLWEPLETPTTASIAEIEGRLACKLPKLLIELARHSNSFSSFFLGLGPNYDDSRHVLQKNSLVRTHTDWLRCGETAPSHLVMITENFMSNHFWCLDTDECSPEHSIISWSPELLTRSERKYHSFRDFLLAQMASSKREKQADG